MSAELLLTPPGFGTRQNCKIGGVGAERKSGEGGGTMAPARRSTTISR